MVWDTRIKYPGPREEDCETKAIGLLDWVTTQSNDAG